MGPHRAWQPPLQQAGGTDDEILFIRHPGDGRTQGEQAGSRQGVNKQIKIAALRVRTLQHRAEHPSVAGAVRLNHVPDRGTV